MNTKTCGLGNVGDVVEHFPRRAYRDGAGDLKKAVKYEKTRISHKHREYCKSAHS